MISYLHFIIFTLISFSSWLCVAVAKIPSLIVVESSYIDTEESVQSKSVKSNPDLVLIRGFGILVKYNSRFFAITTSHLSQGNNVSLKLMDARGMISLTSVPQPNGAHFIDNDMDLEIIEVDDPKTDSVEYFKLAMVKTNLSYASITDSYFNYEALPCLTFLHLDLYCNERKIRNLSITLKDSNLNLHKLNTNLAIPIPKQSNNSLQNELVKLKLSNQFRLNDSSLKAEEGQDSWITLDLNVSSGMSGLPLIIFDQELKEWNLVGLTRATSKFFSKSIFLLKDLIYNGFQRILIKESHSKDQIHDNITIYTIFNDIFSVNRQQVEGGKSQTVTTWNFSSIFGLYRRYTDYLLLQEVPTNHFNAGGDSTDSGGDSTDSGGDSTDSGGDLTKSAEKSNADITANKFSTPQIIGMHSNMLKSQVVGFEVSHFNEISLNKDNSRNFLPYFIYANHYGLMMRNSLIANEIIKSERSEVQVMFYGAQNPSVLVNDILFKPILTQEINLYSYFESKLKKSKKSDSVLDPCVININNYSKNGIIHLKIMKKIELERTEFIKFDININNLNQMIQKNNINPFVLNQSNINLSILGLFMVDALHLPSKVYNPADALLNDRNKVEHLNIYNSELIQQAVRFPYIMYSIEAGQPDQIVFCKMENTLNIGDKRYRQPSL